MRAHADRGSISVVAVLCGCAALTLVACIGLLARAAVGHAQVQTAADLAALAAADAVRGLSAGEPCAIAGTVAKRNGVKLESCIANAVSQSASVTVSLRLPAPLGTIKETAVAGKGG